MDPTLVVLFYATLAAFAAALGLIPVALRRERMPLRWIGWSNALASGLMLGVAYSLMVTGLERATLTGGLGALVGIAIVRLTHLLTGSAELDLNRLDETGPDYGYRVITVNSFHAAHEGIAIGVAMALSLPFGILTALALAVHNIPEAAILGAIVTRRGVPVRNAAMLAVATNGLQVLLAVATFAVVAAAPVLLPWALGFAVGALLYLVMVELLPESYREAGHTSIALVTIVAMGIVVVMVGRTVSP
ncbi:MAG: ZIP family metal transporter [Gemmatimonadetes bacterium]|nr:ZIP family metal transporter [Gemmatimonadota bacterium]